MTIRISIVAFAVWMLLAGCSSDDETTPVISSPTATHSSPAAHSAPANTGTAPSSTAATQQSPPQSMNPSGASESLSTESLMFDPPEYGSLVQVRGIVKSVSLNEVEYSGEPRRHIVLYGPCSLLGEMTSSDTTCELAGAPAEVIGCGDEIVVEGEIDPDWIGGPLIQEATIREVHAASGSTPATPASGDFATHAAELKSLIAETDAHSTETGAQSIYFASRPPGPYRMFIIGNAATADADFVNGVVERVKDNPLVSEVGLSGEFTSEEIRLVSSIEGVQSISFDGNSQLPAVDITPLGELPHLRDLTITLSGKIDDAFAGQLATIDQLFELNLGVTRMGQSLRSDGQDFSLSVEGFEQLSSLTQLRHLRIDTPFWIPDECLAKLAGLTNLKSLDISALGFEGTGFAALSTCAALEIVSIDPRTEMNAAMLEGITSIPSLRAINLSYASSPKIGTDAGTALAASTLQAVNLSWNESELSDEFFGDLGRMPELRVLYLKEVPVTDAQLQQLLQAGCPKLERLDLTAASITDAGLNELIAAPPPNLNTLYLFQAAITADAAAQLATIPTLRTLKVDYEIGEAIRDQVQAQNPNLKIN